MRNGARPNTGRARSTYWATLIFFLGTAALTLVGFRIILFAILVWIAARLIWRWKRSTE